MGMGERLGRLYLGHVRQLTGAVEDGTENWKREAARRMTRASLCRPA